MLAIVVPRLCNTSFTGLLADTGGVFGEVLIRDLLFVVGALNFDCFLSV